MSLSVDKFTLEAVAIFVQEIALAGRFSMK
jgi:hypothetical protein